MRFREASARARVSSVGRAAGSQRQGSELPEAVAVVAAAAEEAEAAGASADAVADGDGGGGAEGGGLGVGGVCLLEAEGADALAVRRDALGVTVDSCSWISIMWSPRRIVRFSGALPDRKSFTCNRQYTYTTNTKTG